MSAIEYMIFIIFLTIALIIGWYKHTSYCAGLEREVNHLKKKLWDNQCQNCRSKSGQRSKGLVSPRRRQFNQEVQFVAKRGQEHLHGPIGKAIPNEEAISAMMANSFLTLRRNQLDILEKLQQVTSQIAKGNNPPQ